MKDTKMTIKIIAATPEFKRMRRELDKSINSSVRKMYKIINNEMNFGGSKPIEIHSLRMEDLMKELLDKRFSKQKGE